MPLPLESTLWKRKLAALLHDPPSKVLDIGSHELHAFSVYSQAGLTNEDELRRLDVHFAKPSDWTASSADRLPFPKPHSLKSIFDGKVARFHHPLSPAIAEQEFQFRQQFTSADAAMTADQTVQPVISDSGHDDTSLWRARFFAHWRLWEKFCVERDYRFALLPADTRIPDHTIWSHMQVVSALDGCAVGYGKDAFLKPAFLKVQIAGVQEFIAQARSTRDLWSGSYLLSWLMAAGLKALAWEIGPDSVVFPNLKGQPLIDLHLKDCLWSKIVLNGKSGWDHVKGSPVAQLTPNLPNVFLAIVPQERAESLARMVEATISQEWQTIASAVWDFLKNTGMFSDSGDGVTEEQRKARFDHQVKNHLNISWQVTAWPESLNEALALGDSFSQEMPAAKAAERVREVVKYATQIMPESDRDSRYYVGGDKGPLKELNNIGLGWSIVLAYNSWQLDAVRRTRKFDGWSAGMWKTGSFQNKDSLSGQVEAVVGGESWRRKAEKHETLAPLFKHDDWLGAAGLIKRVWHRAYLEKRWKLPLDSWRWPSTRQLALGNPSEEDNEFSGNEQARGAGEEEDAYFAVLALDGDSIGAWVSGEKTPRIGCQLSNYADPKTGERGGAVQYFEKNHGEAFLQTNRPLFPSYHLQLSAALSNFALLCAERIVRHFQGRLIYSGGDDVLAMMPSGKALACARALRLAFQGKDPGIPGIVSPAPGFLQFDSYVDNSGNPIPVILPGPEADCSVGVSVAHFRSPLQDAVKAAQQAEKRAKQVPKKGAVGITLLKRSGETVEWTARWDDSGVDAALTLLEALEDEVVSSRFPYRLAELMSLYRSRSSGITKSHGPAQGFDLPGVFERELAVVLARQRGRAWEMKNKGRIFQKRFSEQARTWLTNLLNPGKSSAEIVSNECGVPPHSVQHFENALDQVIALCAFCGFARRQNSSFSAAKLKQS